MSDVKDVELTEVNEVKRGETLLEATEARENLEAVLNRLMGDSNSLKKLEDESKKINSLSVVGGVSNNKYIAKIIIDFFVFRRISLTSELLITTVSVLFLNSQQDSLNHSIILDIRLPRIILSFCVGIALAVSGAVMQGLFRNPLADPAILGVSAGAALGAVIPISLTIHSIHVLIVPIFSSPLNTSQPFLPIALPSIERPTNFF